MTLTGSVVVRDIEEAVRFSVNYRSARRPTLQTSALYRLEGAAGGLQERHAGYAFRSCASAAERLIVSGDKKFGCRGRRDCS